MLYQFRFGGVKLPTSPPLSLITRRTGSFLFFPFSFPSPTRTFPLARRNSATARAMDASPHRACPQRGRAPATREATSPSPATPPRGPAPSLERPCVLPPVRLRPPPPPSLRSGSCRGHPYRCPTRPRRPPSRHGCWGSHPRERKIPSWLRAQDPTPALRARPCPRECELRPRERRPVLTSSAPLVAGASAPRLAWPGRGVPPLAAGMAGLAAGAAPGPLCPPVPPSAWRKKIVIFF